MASMYRHLRCGTKRWETAWETTASHARPAEETAQKVRIHIHAIKLEVPDAATRSGDEHNIKCDIRQKMLDEF